MTKETMRKHLLAACEIQAQIKQLEVEYEKHKKALCDALDAQGKEDFSASGHKCTWKRFPERRFDSSLFRKDHGDLYESYRVEREKTRFSCA